MDADSHAALISARQWRELNAPDDVRAVPTMLSAEELALLYWLARDYAQSEGAIVDAGCFLGGSSAAFLAGLRDRPSPWTGPPLASYDRFIVEEYTLEQYFSDEPGVRVGDSFRPFYDRNVSGYGVPHDVHEGDIVANGWSGGPIEVLFLDVLKSWEINDAVTRLFMPHVIPGRTMLVHQDYTYGEVPWLHITVELMHDSLRVVDEIPWATRLFLVERPIDPEVLRTPVASLDADRKLALIDQAVSSNHGYAREMILLSKAMLLGELGRRDAGRSLAEAIHRETSNVSIQTCAEIILGKALGVTAPDPAAEAGAGSRQARRGGLLGRFLRR